ncbi:MAG: 6,7-dimethyl-8-ribityllumazine synthase [Planctomycetota bacterium]|jgi:6,7-dimethyl-8-ribityllumazine synthase
MPKAKKKQSPKQGRTVEGGYDGSGKQFTVLVTRFNEFVTKQMLDGCLDQLTRHGVKKEAVDIIWVPGAFELATVARKVAAKKRSDAIICIGCIISGDTPHFEHIARAATKGIADVGHSTGVPTVLGVIACETIEQAVERAGTKMGNKGGNAALTALEMANLMAKL